ncbi:GTP cyclohydrolase [Rhodobacteraceae bacterium B1Z28]|uniref:GTP cyclohydrolase n=1 Tax=Ruegeria haliotis TaxID=2747601 RepID=A0ABX2PUY6_9RHOB|nr:YciI family protein [Ruegeria haliotis]NVO56942.1 GTP cyclohydrolase [Ruegeria haliotis]
MTIPKSVFVVDLNYVVTLPEIDAHIPGHVEFLDQCYEAGLFLASGAKIPRTGGVIIASAPSRESLEAHLAQDPFHINGVAEYKITEFQAKKHKPNFFD